MQVAWLGKKKGVSMKLTKQDVELEQMLRRAYRAGQDSVGAMRVIHGGKVKFQIVHECEEENCKHAPVKETSSAEDKAVEEIMKRL